MLNNRLNALEQVLRPANKPIASEYQRVFIEGETTRQAIVNKYNTEHRTSYPLEAFSITEIIFTDKPPVRD